MQPVSKTSKVQVYESTKDSLYIDYCCTGVNKSVSASAHVTCHRHWWRLKFSFVGKGAICSPRGLGDGSPSGGRRQSSGRGLGDEIPQKLKRFADSVCIFRLQKRPKFTNVANSPPNFWPVCFSSHHDNNVIEKRPVYQKKPGAGAASRGGSGI